MKPFPAAVRCAMLASGSAATCVAVRLDDGEWEAALFVQLAGDECKTDRALIAGSARPFSVGIETDVVRHQHAAVVVLRLEIHANRADPMIAEILLTPGGATDHFDVLKRLSRQAKLCWFFGDDHFNVIHAQQHPLSREQRADFDALLRDVVGHDALVRCTGRYDARAALAEIVAHYEPRAASARPRRTHAIDRSSI
ncbi:MAG: hypothetical protein ACREVE_07710 [Gammaproteobacteria bacterium]